MSAIVYNDVAELLFGPEESRSETQMVAFRVRQGRVVRESISPPARESRSDPGMTLAAFICAMLLALFLGGCNGGGAMDLSSYKERVADIHDGVAWDLGYVLESLSGLSVEEYRYLEELGGIFRNAKGIFTSAYQETESLVPPGEAADLHRQLLEFYSRGREETGILVDALGLFQVVIPMLADVQNLALPTLSEQARPEEIKAAAEEDHRTMNMYVGEMEGITPPGELASFLEEMYAFFCAVREWVIGVEQAVPPGELEALAQFQVRYTEVAGKVAQLEGMINGYLGGIGARIDALIEEGSALAAGIQGL